MVPDKRFSLFSLKGLLWSFLLWALTLNPTATWRNDRPCWRTYVTWLENPEITRKRQDWRSKLPMGMTSLFVMSQLQWMQVWKHVWFSDHEAGRVDDNLIISALATAWKRLSEAGIQDEFGSEVYELTYRSREGLKDYSFCLHYQYWYQQTDETLRRRKRLIMKSYHHKSPQLIRTRGIFG